MGAKGSEKHLLVGWTVVVHQPILIFDVHVTIDGLHVLPHGDSLGGLLLKGLDLPRVLRHVGREDR